MLKTIPETNSSPLTAMFSIIREELEEVEALLANELTSQYEFVNKLLACSNRLSGKRLRPALLLLFGKATGKIAPGHIKLAAAIEMVHTATLIHDDILDSADQRRHAKTINCEFGNQAAILTGDFLFSHAFYLTSTLPSTYAAQQIGQATNKVCEGEIRQIGTKEEYDVTESEYLEIIEAKTAVLCSCATKLGSFYAGGMQEQVWAAENYGSDLGIAFQIVDDLLDIVGNESVTGKSLGTDLKQHKPTLPMIHHMGSLEEEQRKQFQQSLFDDSLTGEEIMARLNESGSLEYARQRAQDFANSAINHTAHLKEGDARKILTELPELLLERNV